VTDLILEIVEGQDAGRQVPLGGVLEIGREPGVDLVVNDDQLSRRHARFWPTEQGAAVEDLGSTNGTYVNDQPVQAPRALQPGDRIRCGLTVFELRTRQQVNDQPSAVRPAPDLTALGGDVLAPVPAEQLPPAAPAAAGVPSLMVEESEPAFVPREVVGDPEAESDFQAVARLVDARVKRRTTIATFAVLSIAGLAVLIFFGAGGSGGGSDEDQVKEVAETAAAAVADRDAGKLCDVISTVELERAAKASGQELECERLIQPALDDLNDEEIADAESFEVVSVQVDGDRATAKVKTDDDEDEATFRKEDGDWKFVGSDALS
jgi:pSer/pThr/pTyr-binding forkhead associated (FHA) protein